MKAIAVSRSSPNRFQFGDAPSPFLCGRGPGCPPGRRAPRPHALWQEASLTINSTASTSAPVRAVVTRYAAADMPTQAGVLRVVVYRAATTPVPGAPLFVGALRQRAFSVHYVSALR